MRGEVLELLSMSQVAQRFPGHAAMFMRLCNKVYDAGHPACAKTSEIPVLAHVVLGRDNPDGKHESLPIVPPALLGDLRSPDIIEIINFEGFAYVTDVLVKAGSDESDAACHWVSRPVSGSHIECADDEKNGWTYSHHFGLGIPVKPYVVLER